MKSLIRLGLSLAFGLSLLACSSEKDPKEPKIPPTPEAKVAFTLNLEAEGALSELRGEEGKEGEKEKKIVDTPLDFEVKADGFIKPHLTKGKEYTAHCFVRAEGSDQVFYGSMRLTAESEKKLSIKRGPGSEIKFYDEMAHNPGHQKPGDKYYGFDLDLKKKWYLLVVFGGEKRSGGTDKSLMHFSSVERKNTSHPLRHVKVGDKGAFEDIPYMSGWVELELRKSGGDGNGKGGMEYEGGVAGKEGITFKPLGSLLRIHLKNNLTSAPARVCSFSVTSQIGALKAKFTLLGGKGNDEPQITSMYDDAVCTLGTKFDEIPELAPKAADAGYYLLWVYPNNTGKTGKDALSFTLNIQDKAKGGSFDNLATMPTNYRVTKPLQSGRSYRVELTVDRPMMVLEVLDEYNFTGEGHAHRGTAHSNSDFQMYTYAQAVNIANKASGYHLPEQTEWEMLLGYSEMNPPHNKNLPVVNRDEFFPNNTSFKRIAGSGPGVANYKANAGNQRIVYATRFRGWGSGAANSVLYSAWRYELKVIGTEYMLELKSRYLGPGSPLVLDDIANEVWWNTPDPTEVVRTLPFPGSYDDKGTDIHAPYMKGKWGVYWSATDEPDPKLWSISRDVKPHAAGDLHYHVAGYRAENPTGKGTLNGNIGTLKANQHAAVRLFKDY